MPDVPRGTQSERESTQTLGYAVKRRLTFPLGVFISLWVIWALLIAAFAIHCFVNRNDPYFGVPLGPLGAFELFGGLFTAGYFVFVTVLTGAVWIYRVLRRRRLKQLAEIAASAPVAPSVGS